MRSLVRPTLRRAAAVAVGLVLAAGVAGGQSPGDSLAVVRAAAAGYQFPDSAEFSLPQAPLLIDQRLGSSPSPALVRAFAAAGGRRVVRRATLDAECPWAEAGAPRRRRVVRVVVEAPRFLAPDSAEVTVVQGCSAPKDRHGIAAGYAAVETFVLRRQAGRWAAIDRRSMVT